MGDEHFELPYLEAPQFGDANTQREFQQSELTPYMTETPSTSHVQFLDAEIDTKKSGLRLDGTDPFFTPDARFSVKLELLDQLCQPSSSSPGNAAYDLRSRVATQIPPLTSVLIPLGIKTEFASTHVALLWDRSGLAAKNGLAIAGGVIDSNFRGEWVVVIYNKTRTSFLVNPGDRICQVLFQQREAVNWCVVDSVTESDRGGNGFGSSGVK